MNILIIEDEPFIALDIESALEALHHRVVGVADSKETAVTLARSTPCDGALIDIRLRDGFTGPEIADIFREELDIPFAFLTGNAEQLASDPRGALAVVGKPFSQDQIEKIMVAFQARSASR